MSDPQKKTVEAIRWVGFAGHGHKPVAAHINYCINCGAKVSSSASFKPCPITAPQPPGVKNR